MKPSGEILHYDYKLRRYHGSQVFAVEGRHQEFLLALLLTGHSAEQCVRLAIEFCSHAGGEVFAMRLEEG